MLQTSDLLKNTVIEEEYVLFLYFVVNKCNPSNYYPYRTLVLLLK